ncbi:MAG: hypothetical protein GYA21_18730, partial [Myxococcales bacterium]|nr:hypothetical protein [Myxococcales bacterium]
MKGCLAMVVWFAALFGPAPAPGQVAPRSALESASASVRFDAASQRYTLQASGRMVVTYVVDLADPDMGRGLLRVQAALDRGPFYPLIAGAGTRYRNAQGTLVEPGAYAGSSLSGHRLEGDQVVLEWSERPGARELRKSVRLSLEGLALVVRFQAEAGSGNDGYAGVSLGHAEVSDAQAVEIPYLPVPLALLPDGSVMSTFVDPTRSSSAEVSTTLGPDASGNLFVHSRTLLLPDTADRTPPLDEFAYLAVGREPRDVYPEPLASPSAYRAALSDRLVLDVWNLHSRFGVPAGVTLRWQAPLAGEARLHLEYADADPNCGDGVVISVRHQERTLARLRIQNGETATKAYDQTVALGAGESLRISVDRAGDDACDGTSLRLAITLGAETFDSVRDFSGTQGQRGFYYLEFSGDTEIPLAYNAAQSRWEGSTPFSLIGSGFAHPGGGSHAFADAREMVRRYAEYGLTRLAIIFHDWQRHGYDQGLPDHHPANPALGTGEEMAAFGAEARSAGMLLALHENYTDMYPDNPPDYPSPLYDESAIALDPQGQKKLGWYHPYTHQQAFVIAASRMIDFSRLESGDIARDYAPSAAYLDVSTGWSPGRAIDHSSAHGHPPTLAAAFAEHVALYDFLRGLYRGPLLGEGGEGPARFDTFFAGAVDAVERQTERRRFARVNPEFELLCVRPRMLNHGLGYYSRYFAPFGQETPNVAAADLDQYRASEIAFGHAGFLGDSIDAVPDWLSLHAPEYWLLAALQARYTEAPLLEVQYHNGNAFVSLEDALRSGLDLSRARLRLDYQDLTVFVNRDGDTFAANSQADFSHRQGEAGFEYLEDAGAGPQPLVWDPLGGRWRGARPFSILGPAYAHPDGGAVLLRWTAPADVNLEVHASVQDLDLSCGDGVLARLLIDSVEAWSCDLPGDVEEACPPATLSLAVRAGDALTLRIEQKSNNYCDSTGYEFEARFLDTANHDWSVQTLGGTVTLPPSGFVAEDGSGDLVAGTMRLPEAAGAIADFAHAGDYDYARSRDGVLRTLGALTCDGAIARLNGAFGHDLHGQALTRADAGTLCLLELSHRADVNLRFLDRQRAVVTARRVEGADTVALRWGDLPEAWAQALDAGVASLRLSMCDFEGNPQPGGVEIGRDPSGVAILPELFDGQHYLVWLVSNCGNGSCETGAGEDCLTCPADCPTGAQEVCCGGDIFTGDCCADTDCNPAQTCHEHQCQGGSDGEPDAADAG